MSVGFIHGVMNTDNTTISGETIDYGPCAFIDRYEPNTVYSSIDHAGRYRYGNQPAIAEWNLARLAEALLPLIAADDDVEAAIASARDVLNSFVPRYEAARSSRLRRKLGLLTEREGDDRLSDGLFEAMQADRADLTRTFRAFADDLRDSDVTHGEAVGAWTERWRARLAIEGRPADTVAAAMDEFNPLYVPRNHLVEGALAAAAGGDLAPFGDLLDVVTSPFERHPDRERYEQPAPDEFERGYQTFCGT
jgi:uncharacterized protein YdiU (UPF0061 family)